MKDLTVIYITANAVPQKWMEYQIGILLEAIKDTAIISISRIPLQLGLNILDIEPKSLWNMYMQLLRAAKLAKTPYIAVAEDDTLYTRGHFTEYRPPINAVSYDRSRWSLFIWDNIYCIRQRISNCSLIAPKDYYIDALEERKNKWPNGATDDLVGEVGRAKVDKRLKVSVRNCEEWYSYAPIVQLNHPSGSDVTQKKQWKRHGQLRAFDIPYWGKATEIIKKYEHS